MPRDRRTGAKSGRAKSGRWDLAIASVWGFAEATLFFIVPDVWLTQIALNNLRRGLIASGLAACCAVVGGAVMMGWGHGDPAAAEATLDKVPAVSMERIEWVRQELIDRGPQAIFLGPVYRTPYKIYAVEAGRLGLEWPAFLGLTMPARLLRFALLAALAAGISKGLSGRLSLGKRRALLWIAWLGYYVWHFAFGA